MPIPPTTQLAVGMTLMCDETLITHYKIVFQTKTDNWWIVQGKWTLDGMQFPEDGTWGDWHVDDLRNNFTIVYQ